MDRFGRTGGVRQRAKRAADDWLARSAPCEVAKYLANEWAWGRMSPQQVQSICALLKKDLAAKGEGKLDERLVDDLAAIGSAGRNPPHMGKQLVSVMYGRQRVPRLLRESGQFRAPLKNSIAGRHYETLDFLCPHIVFATLYHDHNAAWRQLMVPSQDKRRRFGGDCTHSAIPGTPREAQGRP